MPATAAHPPLQHLQNKPPTRSSSYTSSVRLCNSPVLMSSNSPQMRLSPVTKVVPSNPSAANVALSMLASQNVARLSPIASVGSAVPQLVYQPLQTPQNRLPHTGGLPSYVGYSMPTLLPVSNSPRIAIMPVGRVAPTNAAAANLARAMAIGSQKVRPSNQSATGLAASMIAVAEQQHTVINLSSGGNLQPIQQPTASLLKPK